VEIDGKPWFVASEVCRALLIHVRDDGSVGTNNAVRKLDADEKCVLTYAKAHRMGLKDGVSRPHGITLVSEPGLYKLIGRSDKPAARAFDRWVRHDVLPAIRKDGAYVSGEEKVAKGELSEDEFVLRALEILQGKVARLREEKEKLAAEKANAGDQIAIWTSPRALVRLRDEIHATLLKLPPRAVFHALAQAGVGRYAD